MHIGWLAEAIDLIFIILGKSGKVLNARGLKICFLIDSICLLYWLYVDIERQLYAQAASVFVGLIINIYGWIHWSKNKIGENQNKDESKA